MLNIHKGELVPGWVTWLVFASVSECMCDIPGVSVVLKLLAINLHCTGVMRQICWKEEL